MNAIYGNKPKLSEWQVRELQARARVVFDHYPAKPGWGERWVNLVALADDYSITVRTLYRYLRRTA